MDPQYNYIVRAGWWWGYIYTNKTSMYACGVMNDTVYSCDNGNYCPLCPLLLTMGSHSTMEGWCHS